MRKIVVIYGIIAGLVVSSMFFLVKPGTDSEISMGNAEILGYTFMIIALGTIFFAVKQFRDQHTEGNITFKQAFTVGIGITLIASVLYVVSWELYAATYAPDFVDTYLEQIKVELAEKGLSEAAIEEKLAEGQKMVDLYKNNVPFRLFITFMEIFPVGLLISLICGLIFGVFLKDKSAAKLT